MLHTSARRTPALRFVCMSVLLLWGGLQARISLALFPLTVIGNDELSRWAGAILPEIVSRRLSTVSGIQVWDPVFLFGADSTGWTLSSDSLLGIHHSRWKWDVALGGEVEVKADSLVFSLQVLRPRLGTFDRSQRVMAVPIGKVIEAGGQLAGEFAALGKASVSSERSGLDRALSGSEVVLKTYATGYAFELQGRSEDALTAYGRALQLEPSLALAAMRMGRIFYRGGDNGRARESLTRALGLVRDPLTVAHMADFIVDVESPRKARIFIESRRADLERTALGMTSMAKYFTHIGQLSRTSALLTRAVAFGPGDLECEYLLGSTYLALGQSALASEIFKRLIACRPEYVGYYLVLGEAYRAAGLNVESAEILEAAREKQSQNASLLIALSHTYFKLGSHAKAEQLLLSARDVNPLLDEFSVNRAVLYWHTGQSDSARNLIGRSLSHRSASAMNNMANVLAHSGNLRSALRLYRRALKKSRRDRAILYNLSRTYLSLGNRRGAYACLEEVSRQLPARIDVKLELGRLARELRKPSDAERHYRRVMELVPFQEQAVAGMVELLIEDKRYEEAASHLEGYLRKYPYSKSFRLLLGEVLLRMEWYEVAEMRFRDALKDYPNDPEVLWGLGQSLHGIVVRKGSSQPAEALALLDRSAQLRTSDPLPDVLAAEIHIENNQLERARERLSQARGKASGDRTMLARIQSLQRKAGQ